MMEELPGRCHTWSHTFRPGQWHILVLSPPRIAPVGKWSGCQSQSRSFCPLAMFGNIWVGIICRLFAGEEAALVCIFILRPRLARSSLDQEAIKERVGRQSQIWQRCSTRTFLRQCTRPSSKLINQRWINSRNRKAPIKANVWRLCPGVQRAPGIKFNWSKSAGGEYDAALRPPVALGGTWIWSPSWNFIIRVIVILIWSSS